MKVLSLGITGISPVTAYVHNGKKRTCFSVTHGAIGKDTWQIVIPMSFTDFPIAEQEKMVLNGDYKLVVFETTDKHNNPRLLLANGKPDNQQLILWSLSPGYGGGAMYSMEGNVRVIAKGIDAQGNGKIVTFHCPVLIVTGPCKLMWSRYGELHGTPKHWEALFDGKNWTINAVEVEK